MNPTTPPKDISFIILTWNSDRYICDCLKALIRDVEQSRLSYEIYIVDNGSKDQTVSILEVFKESFPEKILPTYLSRNMGTTYSRNLALRKATGKYICVMDSDVEILPGTLKKLVEDVENKKVNGLVVPKILYPNGRLQKSTDRFPTIGRKVYRYFFLKNMESKEADKSKITSLIEVDYAISAFWLLPKSVFLDIGLLDENIFYSPEDVDFCMRLWCAGYNICYDPDAVIIHYTQEISRGYRITRALFSHIKGLSYYFIKHRYLFSPPDHRKLYSLKKARHENADNAKAETEL